jgi:AcrR family transcriptional regulator
LRRTSDAPPRGRSRRRLSREEIVETAIELVERDGPQALSMRRLGSELGVEGMAVYYYVAGRDELLSAFADQLYGQLSELTWTGDWREDCRCFASTLRDIAKARPATFVLVGLRPLDTPGSLLAVERLLDRLVAAGFTTEQALAVYRAVASYAHGAALAEAAGAAVDAASAVGRRRLNALDRRSFPILSGHARDLAQLDPDSAYELGLSALLDGLRDPGEA